MFLGFYLFTNQLVLVRCAILTSFMIADPAATAHSTIFTLEQCNNFPIVCLNGTLCIPKILFLLHCRHFSGGARWSGCTWFNLWNSLEHEIQLSSICSFHCLNIPLVLAVLAKSCEKTIGSNIYLSPVF